MHTIRLSVLSEQEKLVAHSLLVPHFKDKYSIDLDCEVADAPEVKVDEGVAKVMFPSFQALVKDKDRKTLLKETCVPSSSDLRSVLKNIRSLMVQNGLYEDMRSTNGFPVFQKFGFRRVKPVFKSKKL